jgi:hypothetical protein
MRTGAIAVAVCAVLLTARPVHAAASDLCSPLRADDPGASTHGHLETGTNHVGVVDLYFQQADGAPVTFYECVHDRPHKLGTVSQPGLLTGLTGAVPWLCGRQQREFRSTTTLSDGRFVRGGATALTPTCAHRFALDAPRRVKRGKAASVRITDRWGIGGLHTRLCITSPSRERHCRDVAFPAAVSTRSVRLRAVERGHYALDLHVRRFHARAIVAAGVKAVEVKPLPLLLATGDSTMNGVDGALGDDLGEFRVRSQSIPGAEISDTDWPAIARTQVKTYRPAVTVMSVGAAEGFPLATPAGSTPACCAPQWIAEYTRRVRSIMRTYRHSGRVYWETIALPRDPARAGIVKVVDQAFIDAAKDLEGVTVLRMDLLFTPDGYQETIRDGGRDVDVREDDGVHLNASGTAIEARETAKAIHGQPTPVLPQPATGARSGSATR